MKQSKGGHHRHVILALGNMMLCRESDMDVVKLLGTTNTGAAVVLKGIY